ncbi:MAG: hypothetical protein HFH08_02565 [Bacilli bacterium]|nr:hypothetical protein [Bacilli bacterium]
MKIYLDLIMILNFLFDFFLLMGVSIILRRNVSINRLLKGAFFGGLSILFLFLNVNSFELFLLKIMISIIMVILTFGFRDIRYTFKNLFYLYSASMILGGFLYYLNVEFSYKQEGIVFYHNGLSINYIVLLMVSPIILFIYVKQGIYLKNNYSNYYQIDLFFDKNRVLHCNGFLDSGNHLVEPYGHKPIILIDHRKFIYDINEFKMILVPMTTASGTTLLECIHVPVIEIKGVGRRENVLLGIMKQNITIDGIDVLLHTKIMEESYV